MIDDKEEKIILPSISKEVFDNLPVGVCIFDDHGNIEYFNQEMLKISGLKSMDEVYKKNVFQIDNYEKYGLLKYFRVGLSGRPFSIDAIRYVSETGGKETYRSYQGIPIKNEEGRVLKLLCIVKNVTTQKILEKEVSERKEEYETIFKNLPFMAFTLDRKGRLLDANKTAEEFVGHKKADLIGKNFHEFKMLRARDLFVAAKEFYKNLKGEVTKKTIYNIKRKDGSIRKVELIGIPIARNGKVIKILDVGTDVTDYR